MTMSTMVRLKRRLGFSCTVVAVLSFGIGASSAVFSILSNTLFRPLAYPRADELRVVGERASLRQFSTWRTALGQVADVAVFRETRGDLTIGNVRHRNVRGCAVSQDVLAVLGVEPLFGHPHFDYKFGRSIVLSYGIWRDGFGLSPAVLGTPVLFNGRPYFVAGVMPNGFGFPDSAQEETGFWLGFEGLPYKGSGDDNVLSVLIRQRNGITDRQVSSVLNAVERRSRPGDPTTVQLVTLRSEPPETVRLGLLICLGASNLLLILSCCSAGGLYVIRARNREREIGVCLALGATLRRIALGLCMEGASLAGVCAIIGLYLARFAANASLRWMPRGMLSVSSISLNGRVVIVATGAALITSIFSAILPVFHIRTLDCASVLRQSGRHDRPSFFGCGRSAFVVAQTAVALVLLIGSAALARTLERLWAVPLGFDGSHALAFIVDLPTERYAVEEDWNRAYDQIRERLGALPGVAAVGGVNALPFWGTATMSFGIDSALARDATLATIVVTPGYLSAMRITRLLGRDFTSRDVGQHAPLVAIVDSGLAAKYWPGERPLGRKLFVEPGRPAEIVGVVEPVHQGGFTEDPVPTVYLPYSTVPSPSMTFVVRTVARPESITHVILPALEKFDRSIAVFDMDTMSGVLSRAVAPQQTALVVCGAFSMVALAACVLGVYSFVAYAVRQRSREIGIRLAMGANRVDVALLLLREAVGPVATGVLLGLAVSGFLMRFAGSLLFEIKPFDLEAFAGSSFCLIGAAAAAATMAGVRIMRVDPAEILRSEGA
jgi:putative ABC transport system permease protein